MKNRHQKMINHVQTDEDHIVMNEDAVRVFEGLRADELGQDKTLLELLELNAEQLTYYLEELILDNPFIDLEYQREQNSSIEEKIEDREKINNQTAKQSLESYLFEQIMLYRRTPIRDAMEQLVGLLDERGFLPYSLLEIAELLDTPTIVILDAVTLFKLLEPAGIGARDLQEALMLQTEQDNFAPNVAYYLLEVYFEELNDKDYTEIMTHTNLTEQEIMTCVNYYHTLRPNPASLFDQPEKMRLVPDVTVTRKDEGLELRYNRQYYPKITFNQAYYHEIAQRKDIEVQDYIKEQANNYYSLANNLRQREQLIMQVVQVIIVGQKNFFAERSDQRTSLSIKKIAEKTRLPEPIIYRAIVNKNIEFNDYVYAFTDFINLATSKGTNGLTAQSIKERIEQIIEMTQDHLTNQDLVERLAKEQVLISEQIVANYRRSLGK